MTSALNDYTPGASRIIRDAQAAGMEVSIEGSRTFIVAKREKRWNKREQSIVVYSNGTAFDALVRLDCAKGVRKLSVIRQMIGL